jgi:hypothetical protein
VVVLPPTGRVFLYYKCIKINLNDQTHNFTFVTKIAGFGEISVNSSIMKPLNPDNGFGGSINNPTQDRISFRHYRTNAKYNIITWRGDCKKSL